MPFGRHKGKRLDQIPRGYLRWAQANVEMSGWLKTAVDAVVAGKPVPPQPARGGWTTSSDFHLDPEIDARIHEVVRDVGYWRGEGR